MFVFPIIFALIGLLVFGWLKRLALAERFHQFKAAAEAEIADLRGRLTTSETNYDRMARIAENALEVAKERHFPTDLLPPGAVPPGAEVKRIWHDDNLVFDASRTQSTYKPPSVTNCQSCGVSVRSALWPVSCPSCGTPIDIEEWPDSLTGLPDRD